MFLKKALTAIAYVILGVVTLGLVHLAFEQMLVFGEAANSSFVPAYLFGESIALCMYVMTITTVIASGLAIVNWAKS